MKSVGLEKVQNANMGKEIMYSIKETMVKVDSLIKKINPLIDTDENTVYIHKYIKQTNTVMELMN